VARLREPARKRARDRGGVASHQRRRTAAPHALGDPGRVKGGESRLRSPWTRRRRQPESASDFGLAGSPGHHCGAVSPVPMRPRF